MTQVGPHYISVNKSNAVPKRLILFDTETISTEVRTGEHEQTFRLGVAVHQRIRKFQETRQVDWFKTTSSFSLCEWIVSKASKKERLYVISSNIWFDLRVSNMLTYLHKERWHNKRLYGKGLTLIISFTKDTKTILFLNFQNFFRTNVREMGLAIGYPKLEVDFKNVSEKELFRYCTRDTEILLHSMNHLFTFLKEKKLGNFGVTFPSIAFNIYRYKYMKNLLLVHQDKEVIELERNAYFGGRCECCKIGNFSKSSFVMIDVNSMYPYLMKTYPYPTILQGVYKEPSLNTLDILLDGHSVIAHVLIETNEPVYVVRKKYRGIFPVGIFEAYLTTPSLKYALRAGHIQKIYKMSVYKQDFIFKEYVDFFYNLRIKYGLENNKPFELLCKNLLNSLYGKFGQKADLLIDEKECDYNLTEREDYFNLETQKQCITTRFFGKETTMEIGTQEGINSIVAICAHVCDYGRIFLWEAMKKAGRKNCYYTDTDCIIMDESNVDLSKLSIHSTKLGHFKIQEKASSLVIKGLKDYMFAGKTKIKGISKKAVQKAPNVYEQMFFPGFSLELRSGIDKPYTIYNRKKVLKREYEKGNVLPSGIVTPFRLVK